jgi:hypothetical protein
MLPSSLLTGERESGVVSERDLMARAGITRAMARRAIYSAEREGHIKTEWNGRVRTVIPILRREAGLPEPVLVEVFRTPVPESEIPF